jgi:hypothetical protein
MTKEIKASVFIPAFCVYLKPEVFEMKKYTNILFDLDGTLTDPKTGF